MSIIRTIKRDNPFVQIDKTVFEDNRLSWKAKGLIGYLLSKPDDWQTYVKDLEKRSKDGKDSVNSGLEELEQYGYLVREKKRNKGRFDGWEYHIYETPQRKNRAGLSENGKSENGKSATSNNELTNTELTNIEKEIYIPFQEIIDYLNLKANKNFKYSTSKTKSLIKARWNEGFTLEHFKQVIDNKVSEWINSTMDKYLRPETLFGTKFESYLNQNTGGTNNEVDIESYYGNSTNEIPDW